MPDYFDSKTLSEYLCVSRRCLAYWVATGYAPTPFYKSRQATLWHRRDIERWKADGFPWCNEERAKAVIKAVGADQVNAMIQPTCRGELTFGEEVALRRVDEAFANADEADE